MKEFHRAEVNNLPDVSIVTELSGGCSHLKRDSEMMMEELENLVQDLCRSVWSKLMCIAFKSSKHQASR